MPRLESPYKASLIKRLERKYPDALIISGLAMLLQGLPDILILYRGRYALLEVKRDAKAPLQPNQDHYVALLGELGFAAFIYPEIEEEVLHALESALWSY